MLWRNQRYVRFRVARLASNLGSQISLIAYPLLVLSLGGTLLQAGVLATCRLAVGTACMLPCGHLADRYSPRQLMIGMDVLRLTVVATIPLAAIAGALAYPQLVIVAVLEGAASAAFGPAATVSLRELVPATQLTKALSQAQASAAVVALLGPATGGLLYGIDRMLPFTVDAVSYALSTALLLSVSLRSKPLPRHADGGIMAGLRWLCGQRQVIRVALFCAVINLIGAALITAVTLNLREQGTPARTIGLVLTCGGIGAVVGSLGASRLVRLGSVRVFLASGAFWTAGLVLLAVVFSPLAAGVVLSLLFSFSPAGGLLMAKITRDNAPPELLGRASTAEQLISTGMAAAGPALAGFLLTALGAGALWLLLAGISAAAASLTILPLYLGRRPGTALPAAGGDDLLATQGGQRP